MFVHDKLLLTAIRASVEDPKIETNAKLLDGRLRGQGLRRVKVDGDGNCLFRSLAHALHGVDHLTLRRKLVDFMRRHRNDFKEFVYWTREEDADKSTDQLFDEYCVIAGRDGVWAGELFVQAFADHYRRRVRIISSAPTETDEGRWRQPRSGAPVGDAVTLAFLSEWHYEPVEEIPPPAQRYSVNSLKMLRCLLGKNLTVN